MFCSLVSPGDRVISVLPTYQQLYSIPESLGAKVKILPLSRENGYLPDLDALRALAVPGTKMICINNPNNPTGALMSRDMLEEIVQIAREAGATFSATRYTAISPRPTSGASPSRIFTKRASP